MVKKTTIKNAASFNVKAPNQVKSTTKGKITRGGDLRSGKSGGTKAKGAL